LFIFKKIIKSKTTNKKEIQIGDNTHNQDQLMKLVNFNVINTIAKRLVNPKPEFEFVFVFFIFVY
jgi:hypothetical protein